MARGTALTEGERFEIVRLFDDGLSRAQIALSTGRSKDTVARVCKAAGRNWDRGQTKRATEAAQLDNRHRRAVLAADLLTDLERLRRELFLPSTLAAVTVQGVPVVQTLPAVLARDLRDRAAALMALVNAHLRLATMDAATDYSSVDSWLTAMTGLGEATETGAADGRLLDDGEPS